MIDPDTIRRARARIPAAFCGSPQYVSEPLSDRLGVPVVVKAESVNPIGSFKGRGTWLAVAELAKSGAVTHRRGIAVASAGNFGQGVAYAGRALGVPVVVHAAERANPAKLDAMRRLGAEVRVGGRDFDAAREAAAVDAAHRGWALLVDGQDHNIAVGAGTMGVEVSEGIAAGDLPPIGLAPIPVGNGALAWGLGSWLRATSPPTRVVGVQAAKAPAMTLSWRAGRGVSTETAETIADGIATRVPVPEALAGMTAVVDDMVLVREEQIAAAVTELRGALPLSIEPSAAAAWAWLRDGQTASGAVLLVITGGNVPTDDAGALAT